MNIFYINRRQIYEMERHKYLSSEKAGYDLGEEARYDWINRYASIFRQWADNLPSKCIRCTYCCYTHRKDIPSECPYPFNKKRIELLACGKIDPPEKLKK